MNAFGEEMCSLYEHGIPVRIGDSLIYVKLGIFLGIVDLQAKGYILNMTMHNGEWLLQGGQLNKGKVIPDAILIEKVKIDIP